MAINETTTTQGAYVVAPEYLKEVHRLIGTYSVVRNVFKPVFTNSKAGYLAEITTLPTVYFPDEGNAATASQSVFDQKTFAMKRFAAQTEVSIDWTEDTFSNERESIIEPMLEALAKSEDVCILLGDGSPTYNSITGLANVSLSGYADNIIDMGGNDFTYDKITLGSALISEQKGMASGLIVSPRGLRNLKLMKDDNGRYLFSSDVTNSNTIISGKVGTIDGIPVYESLALKDYEDANASGIAFMVDGNKFGKLIVRYNDVKFKKEEVQQSWKYAYNIYERLDFTVLFPQLLVRYTNLNIA